MTQYLINDTTLTNIGDAIRTQLGTSTLYDPVDMPAAIASISGGGTTRPSVDDNVVLFDYDGTVLYSYSKADFLALSSLPQAPSHTDKELAFDGWNWSLENAKEYLSPTGYNMPILLIGAIYHYDSDDTILEIELNGNNSPYLTLGINGTVTIDWGDGSATETMTGTNATSYQRLLHEYANNGTYEIKITPDINTIYSLGNSDNRVLMGRASGSFGNTIDNSYVYSLKKLKVGRGVHTIYSNSFRYSYGLEEVYLSDSVTLIEGTAFDYDYQLNTIVLNEGVNFSGSGHFGRNEYHYIGLPKSATTIPQLYHCTNLEYVSISDSATTGINDQFRVCYNLKKITYPSTYTNINQYAFRDCEALRIVTAPAITTLSHDCFESSYNFSLNTSVPNTVVEPSTLSNLSGSDHYYAVRALKSVTLSSNRTTIPSTEFYECTSLEEINLEDTQATSIGGEVFKSCYRLANITLPDTVTSIGNNAFSDCRSLTTIYLSNSLTTIDNSVFSNNFALLEITIPATVTSIGSSAFSNCYSLKTVKFMGTTPPTVSNSNAWTNLPTTCKILVPQGSLADYTSATNYPNSSTYTYEEY